MNVHDLDLVTVEDSQTDSDEYHDVISKETTIYLVVFEQVYENTEKFDTIMKEKGSHFLEPNTIMYPNIKCLDEVVLPNQVFVTSGNGDKVKPKINKLVKEDNKNVLKEGFFSTQNTVENNLIKNSCTFQRQKPQRKRVVKTDNSKVEKQETYVSFQKSKINYQNFKDQVEKVSKENEISKRKARKKVYWQHVESKKT